MLTYGFSFSILSILKISSKKTSSRKWCNWFCYYGDKKHCKWFLELFWIIYHTHFCSRIKYRNDRIWHFSTVTVPLQTVVVTLSLRIVFCVWWERTPVVSCALETEKFRSDNSRVGNNYVWNDLIKVRNIVIENWGVNCVAIINIYLQIIQNYCVNWLKTRYIVIELCCATDQLENTIRWALLVRLWLQKTYGHWIVQANTKSISRTSMRRCAAKSTKNETIAEKSTNDVIYSNWN